MSIPIKFDPNDRIPNNMDKTRKVQAPEKFKEIMEDNSEKGVAKLKKHNKGLDADTEDLEEFGTVVEDKKEVSLFELSAKKKERKDASLSDHSGSNQDPEGQLALNPGLLIHGANAAITQVKTEAMPPKESLQKLIDQIVAHVSELSYAGKTETIVTLKHPPLFANATLVLTSFDSAKGEFNISFENLTQKAKAFLDTGAHLDDLKTGLEQKGFVAHIIITTTIEETKVTDNYPKGFQEREPDEQQKKKQDQPQDEQEDG